MSARSLFSVICSASGRPSVAASGRPQLKVGILSDIQYANVDDATGGGSKRYYRNALTSVEQAVSSWTLQSVDCVVNLGDIIDAYNMVTDSSEQALQAVLDALAKLPEGVDVRHVLGNHCVCHPVERMALLEKLGIAKGPGVEQEQGYYSFSPGEGWRLVVLDGCDVSTYAWDKEHPNYQEAHKILTSKSDISILPDRSMFSKLLKAKRKEAIKESDYTTGLSGLDQRYVFYNGAVSERQLEWLNAELSEAEAAGQRVLVFCHMPLLPGICRPSMLLWNYAEVLDALHEHEGVIEGVFCGHAHRFGFMRDEHGIPHMSVPAVLETKPGSDGHGVIEAHNDKIVVSGFGRPDMVWSFADRKKRQLGAPADGSGTTGDRLAPAGV